jgi:Diacylglycerol kinase catalytic domain
LLFLLLFDCAGLIRGCWIFARPPACTFRALCHKIARLFLGSARTTPEEEAMLPDDVPSFSYNAKPGCTLHYDEKTRLLKIVDGQGTILDVIETDDMIGARLEIEMKKPGKGPSLSSSTRAGEAITKDGSRDDNEPPTDALSDGQGSTALVVFVYPRRNVSTSSWSAWLGFSSTPPAENARPSERPHHKVPRVAHHRTLQLEPSEDFGPARRLVEWLRTIAAAQPQQGGGSEEASGKPVSIAPATTTTTTTPKRYWIIVNPMAGPKKNAAVLATTVVVPMLEQANIDCTIFETTHAKHGQTLFKDTDGDAILAYDAVVLLGGDGILHEVLNGLRERSDAGRLLQHMQRIPIGMVGCGTSNGLATSLTHAAGEASGVVQNTFLIAKGRTIQADVASYQIGTDPTAITTYTSFLTFTWAMIADLDIDSECLRFLGESRYDVWYVFCGKK